MTTRSSHLFSFVSDFSDVDRDIKALAVEARKLESRLEQLGDPQAGRQLGQSFSAAETKMRTLQAQVLKTRDELKELIRLDALLDSKDARGRQLRRFSGEDSRALGLDPTRAASAAEITNARDRLEKRINAAKERGNRLVEEGIFLERELAAAKQTTAQTVEAPLERRQRAINAANARAQFRTDDPNLEKQFNDTVAAVDRVLLRLEKLGDAPGIDQFRQKLATLTDTFVTVGNQIAAIDTRLEKLLALQSKLRSTGGAISSLTSEEAALFQGDFQPEAGGVGREKAELAVEREINDTIRERAALEAKADAASLRLTKAARAEEEKITRELDRRLGRDRTARPTARSITAADRQRQEERVSRGALTNTERDQITRRSLEGPLEKTIFTAFRGAGQRFITAFQFAFSGSLIFIAQRLGREFIEAALEVERTFADIGTSLELDLEARGAGRGTGEFERVLESVRQDVLLLADELNVLPSQANEAAFVMVSRFTEVTFALQATRAQLLATQIATIDQAETLRALTAVSEGFSAQALTTSSILSAEEQLFQRQAASAANYGKALDVATFIQQQYGITVEDTLEGTARATEVFAQLGFTLEETAALVALVSRQLGVTGTVAAEKLGRAFSQLTAPEIRDELLDLASTSELFSLSVGDFRDGATAWQAIASSVQELRGSVGGDRLVDQIIQTLGSRRETDVIAAALATSSIADAAIAGSAGAANAAQKRFDILKETTAEIVESIVGQFQELAQNLQELGLLAPLQLFLKAVDSTLNAANELLKTLRNIFGLFDGLRIGGFGVGELITVAGSLFLAGKGIERLLGAVVNVQDVVSANPVDSVIGRTAGGTGVSAGLAGFFAGSNRAGKAANTLAQNISNSGGIVAATLGRLTSALKLGITNLLLFSRQLLLNGISRFSPQLATQFGLITARGGVLARGFQRFGTGISRVTAFLTGPVIGALALLGVGIAGLVSEIREGQAAVRDLRERQRNARVIAETEARAGGASDADVRIAGLEAELEELRRSIETQAGEGVIGRIFQNITGVFGGYFTELVDTLRGTERDIVREIDNDTGQDFSIIQRLMTEEFQGQIRERIDVIDDAFRDARLGVRDRRTFVVEGLKSITPFVEGNLEQFAPGTEEALDAEFLRTAPEILQAKALEIVNDIDRLTELGDFVRAARIAELLDTALADLEEAESREDVEAVLDILDTADVIIEDSILEIDATVQRLAAEIQDINDGVTRGRTALSQSILQLKAKASELVVLADELRENDPEGAQNALREAAQARQQANDNEIALIDRRIQVSQATENEQDALATEIDLLREKIQTLDRQSRNFGTDYLDAVLRLRQAQIDLAKSILDERIEDVSSDASLATDLASSAEEEVQILQDQLEDTRALIKAAEAFFKATGDDGPLKDLIELSQRLKKSIDDSKFDILVRRIEAETRQQFAINDPLGAVRASIAGIREQLKRASGVEALELQIALNEALAEQATILADRAAEWIKTQVGVNAELEATQAELAIVRERLKLTGVLFGQQSAEYARLVNQQDQLENELNNYALELADIGRRLDSDLTSSFEQSQLDLIAILQQQQTPDLGKVEQERLKFEEAQARVRDQAEFYNNRLFELRFAFETDEIGTSSYISYLQTLLDQVDTTSEAGKRTFLQIQGIIDGLADDVSDFAFNIPGAIRLPTLFEVRRAVTADQLGVNYQDNRQQDIQLFISNEVDLDAVVRSLESAFGTNIDVEASRLASGGSALTLAGFN